MTDVREEDIDLGATEDGSALRLRVLRFGTPGARPKAYLQAGLHANELPGMLVLRALAERLREAAGRDAIVGEIVLVPVANPIGLAQRPFGVLQGRVDAASGENFNRGYPKLSDALVEAVAGLLGDDAAANVMTIRAAIAKLAADGQAEDRADAGAGAGAGADAEPDAESARPIDALRRTLFGLACDADIVLDVHADDEALLHLYTGTPLWPRAEPLAAELDARTVLLCERSGGEPFDEACSAPWWSVAAAFPDVPVPPACFAATVELRSNNEVEQRHVEGDSAALERFLVREGLLDGTPRAAPRLLCEATALTAMQQVKASCEGVVVYETRLGDTVRTGDVIATVTDPLGASVEVLAETDGILFARHDQRFAWPGKVIGKIAGQIELPERSGQLLTD